MSQKTPAILPPALMLQGTCSNAGKSLLTAAFCRIFTRLGLRVAPFKAQNMALNSAVTPGGGEMGRAQVVQALACGREPDVRMNPILLKPTSHEGSHVILLGKPVGQMRVHEYFQYKKQAWKHICRAYQELASDADLMLLEGAGSPAEINLRTHDIVNMRMARAAQARVLLVADIDRGGAFASLVGTMALLTRSEKSYVAGFLLNKFRGNASLLEPALHTVHKRTGKPFLGTIPMIQNLQLPEEDSVSFKGGQLSALSSGPANTALFRNNGALLDIALVDLPHASNITDIDALRVEKDVAIRRVQRAADLGCPHLCLLPGSRNTLADADFLVQSGLHEALIQYAEQACRAARDDGFGGMIIGICGGLQLLGEKIADPLHLEAGGERAGLGLLSLVTTLAPTKHLRQGRAHLSPCLTGQADTLTGYEIHHGISRVQQNTTIPIIWNEQQQAIGWGKMEGNFPVVFGSYLHGLFDTDTFRHNLLRLIRLRAGRTPSCQEASYNIGPELDRLADTVEQHCDLQQILNLLHIPALPGRIY